MGSSQDLSPSATAATPKSAAPWLRMGHTIYALQHAGWRKGVEQLQNRWSAHVQGGPGATLEELRGIAILIAAAPDLLKALKAVDAVIDLKTPITPDEYPSIDAGEINAAFALARAAIAKATGQKGSEAGDELAREGSALGMNPEKGAAQ